MSLNYILLGFKVEYIFPVKVPSYKIVNGRVTHFCFTLIHLCVIVMKAHSLFLFTPESLSYSKPILSSTDKHPYPMIQFWWLLWHNNPVQVTQCQRQIWKCKVDGTKCHMKHTSWYGYEQLFPFSCLSRYGNVTLALSATETGVANREHSGPTQMQGITQRQYFSNKYKVLTT